MAQFEKREYPEINRIGYHITDDYGNVAELTPEQTMNLLEWLYERKDELFQLSHGQQVLLFLDELPSWITKGEKP